MAKRPHGLDGPDSRDSDGSASCIDAQQGWCGRVGGAEPSFCRCLSAIRPVRRLAPRSAALVSSCAINPSQLFSVPLRRPRRSCPALTARTLDLPPWIRSSYSSGSRRIGRHTSMSPASAPHLHRRTIAILTAVPLGDLRRWKPALGIPFMRYNLVNPRNASRRRGWLLPCSAGDYVAGVVCGRMRVRRSTAIAALVG